MREIKFRGKGLKEDKSWYIGDLIRNYNGDYSIGILAAYADNDLTFFGETVDPKTIGQFIGLKDKKGLQEVYEGDIIDIEGNIIGNVYENKEILEDGSNCFVKGLCTKDWRDTEEEIIKRGCQYAE